MKIKINTDEATMNLKDGTQMNYRAIRLTKDLRKIIFYNEKGVKEIFKIDMTKEESTSAEKLKKLDERTLIKLDYVSKIDLANIQALNKFF